MQNALAQTIAPPRAIIRLPQLAAMMLLFLGLTTNTHLDAASSWPALAAAPQPVFADATVSVPNLYPAPANQNDPSFVLSARDAQLYRAAFAAQEKTDWKSADDALALVKDKRLVGHVLADRYMRRDISMDEARQWLDAYADLPESGAIYDKARHLRGFATAHIGHPVAAASWTGGASFGNPLGFRSQAEIVETGPKARIVAKINNALHRRDPITAREILSTELQRGTLTVAQAGDIVSHIAAAFFYQGQIERARPMAHMAAQSGVPLGLWLDGLSAWKQQDFTFATRSFASLAQAPGLSPWDRAAASYWAYRAAKRSGDEVQARHWLAEAAKYPHSFYGYMAASLSGHSAPRSWKMPDMTARNIDILSARPEGWQALALAQIGQNDLAESELRRLNPTGSRDLQNAALALAEKTHMPALTLQLAGMATNDNGQPYEAAQYPLPPWEPANGFKVDRALIYALMKRESQFDPEAVSQSGACGLMQIMPSTAHLMSSENKAGRDCPDRLFDPATNIELGQKYVRVLAGQPMIGDNLVLLLASYNGGPGNVAHWLDGEGRGDPLLFLESMPLRETRDYVQQVLMHYWMYRSRLAEPETSVAQLARGEWPRYALGDSGIAAIRQAGGASTLEMASAIDNISASLK